MLHLEVVLLDGFRLRRLPQAGKAFRGKAGCQREHGLFMLSAEEK